MRSLQAPLPSAYFSLNLSPDAREGGDTFVPTLPYARGFGIKGHAANPVRSAEEASRRARGRIRRHCSTYRLNWLGTLTFTGEGCHDQRQLRTYAGEFFRQMRFAVGRAIPRSLIESARPHGFVHIKLLGDLPVGSGPLGESRKAAGYLSKYVANSFLDTKRIDGLHRYDKPG